MSSPLFAEQLAIALATRVISIDEVAEALVPILDACFRQTQDLRFRKAHRALLDRAGAGRPSLDIDDDALIEMRWLLETGRVADRTEAAEAIAHRNTGNSMDATVRRLVRKYRRRFPVTQKHKIRSN